MDDEDLEEEEGDELSLHSPHCRDEELDDDVVVDDDDDMRDADTREELQKQQLMVREKVVLWRSIFFLFAFCLE